MFDNVEETPRSFTCDIGVRAAHVCDYVLTGHIQYYEHNIVNAMIYAVQFMLLL